MIDAIHTFGWNYKAWERPFKNLKIDFLLPGMRILEIGASRYSITSLAFDGMVDEIVVGYYDEQEKLYLENYLAIIQRSYNLQSKYVLQKVDGFSLDEKFNLILMKSVLGGLMRTNETDIEMVHMFINRLLRDNVEAGGGLVTLDNGKPFFHQIIKYLGARKNKWRYFITSDFKNFDQQYSFGTFSAFCLATRLGSFGSFIDNQFLYVLDTFMGKFFNSNPTVIATMYRKCNINI
jgi:hypothetical protein